MSDADNVQVLKIQIATNDNRFIRCLNNTNIDNKTAKCGSDLINTTEKQKPKDQQFKSSYERCRSYLGLLFAVLSGVFSSLSSVIVKYIKNISTGELVAFRYLAILVFSLPLVVYNQKGFFGPIKCFRLLIIRSLAGATTMFLAFMAFRYLPVGEASVVIFSMPIFVAVFARIFLNEPCGWLHSFTIFISLIGLILIAKPPFIGFETIHIYNKEYIYGVGGAIGSLICGVILTILTRKLRNIHYSITLFNFGWIATVETAALTFVTDKFTIPTCGLTRWLVILLGIFGFFGQMFLILAIKNENAGPVSVVRSGTDIILAFLWQVLFFIQIPDKYTISGAVLVTFSIILITLQNPITTFITKIFRFKEKQISLTY